MIWIRTDEKERNKERKGRSGEDRHADGAELSAVFVPGL